MVLGFPCDQFGHQEPGDETRLNSSAQQLHCHLPAVRQDRRERRERTPPLSISEIRNPGFLVPGIKWNFTKFLVGSDGAVLKRYAPSDKPEMIEADLATKL